MDKIIGRSEKISLIDLGFNSKAKIDTGAFTTVIHVDGVKIVGDKLQFWIGDKSNKFIFDKYKRIVVRNSFPGSGGETTCSSFLQADIRNSKRAAADRILCVFMNVFF